jgi:hypothetical protein
VEQVQKAYQNSFCVEQVQKAYQNSFCVEQVQKAYQNPLLYFYKKFDVNLAQPFLHFLYVKR